MVKYFILAWVVAMSLVLAGCQKPEAGKPPMAATGREDAEPPESAAAKALREKLNEDIREISAENQGLEKVINFLQENVKINIVVKWDVLEKAGVQKNTPVNLAIKDVPAGKVI